MPALCLFNWGVVVCVCVGGGGRAAGEGWGGILNSFSLVVRDD